MPTRDALTRLADVLRAENARLAACDAEGAAALLPEKQEAVDALRHALPRIPPTPATLSELRALATENAERLRLAVEVQSRILEMVGRAARRTAPTLRYGARGALPEPGAAALRARA